MWAIRILNGTQAGQVHVLKDGKNRIGRGDKVDFKVPDGSVSKEHLEITVMDDKVLFTDLGSSNGTFLNGVKVKGGTLQFGDKFGVGNVLCDIIQAHQRESAAVPAIKPASLSRASLPKAIVPPSQVPVAMSQQVPQVPAQWQAPPMPTPVADAAAAAAPQVPTSFPEKFDSYVNNNLLPPLYQATEQFEFKMVLLGILGVYVVAITALALIPMKQITSDSIATESRRRAITVARSLSRGNEKVVRTGDVANFSTEFALKEEGVDDVYVLSKDGRILAPPERVGSVPKEAGFFKSVVLKSTSKELAQELDGKIVAAIPINGYDAETQQNVAKAYAVVVYNPGTLSFDDGRVFSLFVQTLALALGVGAAIYFILYRLIQFPFVRLTEQLDVALRENRDHVDIKVQLPVLHKLMTNINSLLGRAANAGSGSGTEVPAGARNNEYFNLANMVGYPCMILSRDSVIIKCNQNFEALLGLSSGAMDNQSYTSIPDQALQKNIEALIGTSQAMTSQTAMDKLEIGSHQFVLSCQAMTTSTGEVDCFFLTIKPAEGAEGHAA